MTGTARRWLPGAVAVLCCVGYLAGLQLLRGNTWVLQAFDDIGMIVVSAVAAVLCARRARARTDTPHAWWFLSANAVAFALGMVVWTWYQLVADRALPFPSLADIAYVAQVPLTAAAILCFATTPIGAASRLRTVFDGLLAGVSLLFIAWIVVVEATYRSSATAPLFTQALGLFYPVSDVVVTTLLVIVVVRNGGRPGRALLTVGAGILTLAAAHVGYALLTATGGYVTGHWIDVLWVAAFLLFALAAVTPPGPTPAPRTELRSTAIGAATPFVFAIAAAGFGIVKVVRHGRLDPFETWAGLAVVLLVMVRQLLSLLENIKLSRELEARVLQRTQLLAESEERYRSVVDSVHAVIFQTDLQGHTTFLSRSWWDIAAVPVEESLGRPIFDFIHVDDHAQQRESLAALLTGTSDVRTQLRLLAGDGTTRWVDVSAYLIRDPSGLPTGLGGTLIDVTAQREAQELVRDSEERWRLLLESSGDGIYGIDLAGRCTFVNAAAAAMLRIEPARMLGAHVHTLVHHSRIDGTPYPNHECPILRSFTRGVPCRVEEDVLWRPDGSYFPVDYTAQPVIKDGLVTGVVVTFNDVTERLAAQDEIRHRALHDDLTGLPNRTMVTERLEQAARGAGPITALLVMDLDRFKDINDTFGHPVGDRVLQQVAERLTGPGLLRAADTVGRLGGDEFAVVLPSLTRPEDALAVADKIVAALAQPIELDDSHFLVGTSIGVTISPDHGVEPAVLLQRADVAMYMAKAAGGGAVLYTTEDDKARLERLQLISELRTAIAQDQLLVHYQPIIDLRTGALSALEALVRWNSPTRGMVPPDAFIGVAEQSGLIMPLTMWVLRDAMRQSRLWRSEGIEVPVAVNISAHTLYDPELLSMVEQWHAGPALPGPLEMEITESAVVADPGAAVEVLAKLAAHGVRVSIDDFGTGYSSLAQLKLLPVHAVKIDRTFVRDMGSDRRDASIVRSVIQLGHTLNLHVVAEGVESLETAQELQRLGCDFAQGWHFGRPGPANAITARLIDASGTVQPTTLESF
jgi:diguanylate cyclase (GGDEF)-like protein/PAS domain S-box-containing protein